MVNIFSVWYFNHLHHLNNFDFNEMNKIQKIAETGLQCYAEMKMIFSNLHKTLHYCEALPHQNRYNWSL